MPICLHGNIYNESSIFFVCVCVSLCNFTFCKLIAVFFCKPAAIFLITTCSFHRLRRQIAHYHGSVHIIFKRKKKLPVGRRSSSVGWIWYPNPRFRIFAHYNVYLWIIFFSFENYMSATMIMSYLSSSSLKRTIGN